ncbi:MPK4, partial [Symbiodinium sp. CCMP2456]
KGTYGAVSAFRDDRTGEEFAVKKIPNPCRNTVEAKRCLREIKLLSMLEHECIIKLVKVLEPPSTVFTEVYLVTELMDADLHTVICSDQPLSEDHVQFFIYQILRALLYLHSANVVHRDLKPLNVLVNKNCDIKLCDFGLARGRAGFDQDDDTWLRTEYVGTRWYRAPEVILTSREYTAAVDMWSAGCILGELISRAPMFRGADFLDQLRSICAIVGTPEESELSFIPEENQAARNFLRTKYPGLPRQNWKAMFPHASDTQCDLLDRLLQFDPNKRLTAHDALRHAYLEDHHDEEAEAKVTQGMPPPTVSTNGKTIDASGFSDAVFPHQVQGDVVFTSHGLGPVYGKRGKACLYSQTKSGMAGLNAQFILDGEKVEAGLPSGKTAEDFILRPIKSIQVGSAKSSGFNGDIGDVEIHAGYANQLAYSDITRKGDGLPGKATYDDQDVTACDGKCTKVTTYSGYYCKVTASETKKQCLAVGPVCSIPSCPGLQSPDKDVS